MQYLLEINDVGYSYHTLHGETAAIKGITFGVKKGEFVAVVGPSGCGKSTLLSIIAGLLKPEHGSIVFNAENDKKGCPRVGYMLQHDYLFEWRSVYKNVLLGLEINHMLTPERIDYVNRLLREYNLEKFKNKRPRELSGGMRQRAALIRTLAMEPEILLLDEPFSALDYQTRLMVSADICSLIRNTGKTMLIITHDLSEAISIADRVIILSGRPACVKCELPIKLTLSDSSPLASRNAPEFNGYFNKLWEVLTSE
jgi:NitT/TauT family transport system ATP-binding protein